MNGYNLMRRAKRKHEGNSFHLAQREAFVDITSDQNVTQHGTLSFGEIKRTAEPEYVDLPTLLTLVNECNRASTFNIDVHASYTQWHATCHCYIPFEEFSSFISFIRFFSFLFPLSKDLVYLKIDTRSMLNVNRNLRNSFERSALRNRWKITLFRSEESV